MFGENRHGNRWRRTRVLGTLLFWMGFVEAGLCLGMAQAQEPFVLGTLKVQEQGHGLIVTLPMEGLSDPEPNWTPRFQIQQGEDWIQVSLPGMALDPPRQMQTLSRSPVEEVFAFPGREGARIRFYVQHPQDLPPRDGISVSREGNDLVIHLTNVPLPSAGRGPKGTLEGGSQTAAQASTRVPSPSLRDGEPFPKDGRPSSSFLGSAATQGRSGKASSMDPMPSFTPGWAALRVALGLLGILLLMGGLYWGFHRWLGGRWGWGSGKGGMRVLSSLYLGPKQRLALVEVQGEQLVLGISEGRITLLCRRSQEPEAGLATVLSEEPQEKGSGSGEEVVLEAKVRASSNGTEKRTPFQQILETVRPRLFSGNELWEEGREG